MPSSVANRYAVALADVVGRPGAAIDPAAALEQLASFHDLLTRSAELLLALTSPTVPPAGKRSIVGALGERIGLSTAVRNFLFVVIDHHRLRLLGDMIAAFRAWLDDKNGIARISITSAQPVDEATSAALRAKFERVTGRRVQAEFGVDESLLGGLVVRHGSTVYDGSVQSQLKAMRQQIAGEL